MTSNDIYNNLVGIAVANASSGCMIANNGVDRNKYQGITVYSGASNALVTNSLHSNGTAKENAYAHIDVGTAVTQVCISNNNFTPQDADVTNVASFCVYVAPGGQTAPVATWLGADGTSVLGGVDVSGAVVVNGVPGATAGARFAGGTRSGAPTSGTWRAGDFVIDQAGQVWIYTGSAWVANGGGSSGGGTTVDNSFLPLADAIVATPGNAAKASPANHQHPRTYWNPSDQGLVTWTMDVMTATANSILPARGTLYLVRCTSRSPRLLHRALRQRDDAAALRPGQQPDRRRVRQRGHDRQLPGGHGEHRADQHPAGHPRHAHLGQHRVVASAVLTRGRSLAGVMPAELGCSAGHPPPAGGDFAPEPPPAGCGRCPETSNAVGLWT